MSAPEGPQRAGAGGMINPQDPVLHSMYCREMRMEEQRGRETSVEQHDKPASPDDEAQGRACRVVSRCFVFQAAGQVGLD